jgi:hypothetical protein
MANLTKCVAASLPVGSFASLAVCLAGDADEWVALETPPDTPLAGDNEGSGALEQLNHRTSGLVPLRS